MIYSREAVIHAIAECDRLGREEFLDRYGFGRARDYFLLHGGKMYDSKAIVGVAYGLENPEHGPLSSSDFVGGRQTVQSWLERLGFEVKGPDERRSGSPPASETARTSCSSPRPVACLGMTGDAAVSDICNRLHQWLNSLPVFSFPFPAEEIPHNGIYVLFENEEDGHGVNRIVRIGTHTGNDQLRSRLTQHFVNENKDRSIFRKNIGRSLLNRNQDAFLEAWNLDLTTRAARSAHSHRVDFEKQRQVEKQVSERIQQHFRFAIIEVQGKNERIELESKLISTVSPCDDCGPSRQWLGLHSPKRKIRESGLWQVNELYKVPLTLDDIRRLESP